MPKGKKNCPKCKKELGSTSARCECGHVFGMSVAASNQSMVVDPLSKQVAESVNNVKNIIAKVDKNPTREKVADKTIEALKNLTEEIESGGVDKKIRLQNESSNVNGKISAPAGNCPVTPKGFRQDGWPDGGASEEVIQNWAIEVYNRGNGNYSVNAIIYWARFFWPKEFWAKDDTEYRRVLNLIVKALRPEQSN